MHLEFNSPNAELAVQMDVKSVIVRSRQASNGCLSLVCQGETPLQVIMDACMSTVLALRHVRRLYAQLHLLLWTVLSWSTFSEAKTHGGARTPFTGRGRLCADPATRGKLPKIGLKSLQSQSARAPAIQLDTKIDGAPLCDSVTCLAQQMAACYNYVPLLA